jgi:hypothetical protein
MTQYLSFVPGITVAGPTIRVFVDALQSFSVLRETMLEVLGVTTLDDDHWYPQERVLAAYQKADYLLGGRGLERFGRLVPTRAHFPPGIDDAHALLSKIDAIYHLNHRRDGVLMLDVATGAQLEGIGHYHYERVGDGEVRITCDNPYPCRFDVGLMHGFAARFQPDVVMVHEPDTCRARGDACCVLRATW